MFVAVFDDLLRGAFVDSGDVAKQRPRCCVQIDADTIDARLDRAFQPLHQLFLFHVVLILADADRLRIDLHQLCERILQAASDGDGSADGQVEFGELLTRDVGCGVHRSARFVHDDTEGFAQSGLFAGNPARMAAVSRDPVPLPIAIARTLYLSISLRKVVADPTMSFFGSSG